MGCRLPVFFLAVLACLYSNWLCEIRIAVRVSSESVAHSTSGNLEVYDSQAQRSLQNLGRSKKSRIHYGGADSSDEGLAGSLRARGIFASRRHRFLPERKTKGYRRWAAPVAAVVVFLVRNALRERCDRYYQDVRVSTRVGIPFRRLANREFSGWQAACNGLQPPSENNNISALLNDSADDVFAFENTTLQFYDHNEAGQAGQTRDGRSRRAVLWNRDRLPHSSTERSPASHCFKLGAVIGITTLIMIFAYLYLTASAEDTPRLPIDMVLYGPETNDTWTNNGSSTTATPGEIWAKNGSSTTAVP